MHLVLPSLVQSKCNSHTEDSQSHSIVTLNTPTGYTTNEEETDIDDGDATDTDSSSDEASSEPSDTYQYHHNGHNHNHKNNKSSDSDTESSSDWEPSISMASTYLPRKHKKSNPPKLELKTYNSIVAGNGGFGDNASKKNIELLESIDTIIFYPYCNLQSLLFSHLHPYIENDYKKIKDVNVVSEDEQEHNEDSMDWNDKTSVDKIKDLINNLLVSASLTIGIKEDELYLMFSSPSPSEIIEHLRFGKLSLLCDVHIGMLLQLIYIVYTIFNLK